MVRHVSWDSSIQLQCKYLHMFTGKVSWRLNGSLIESHRRYSQNYALLSIKNLTADDKYIYTCNELEGGFDSDPYRLNISGPNVVKFVSNVTVAKEHEGLHLFCNTDCYPTCTWNWTQLELLSTAKKVISANDELKINNVTREDAGKYSCKVYNIITGASLEGGFTYLEVVYGPDEIYTNVSDNIIQVNESETISVFCYSDCFPPCQFGWIETNTNTPIRGAELKLESVTVDINYTCYASNPMNAKASNSGTIYIKVRPGVSVFTTTTLTPGNNTDFPSIHHLLYFGLGLGVLLAIGLLACLLHKFMACSHVGKSSSNSSSEHSKVYRENKAAPAEQQTGNYWTLVSNERGELTIAIDVDNAQCIMQTPPGIKEVLKKKNLEHSIGPKVDIELEEYLEPIHSDSVEHDDYIHPVHSGHVES